MLFIKKPTFFRFSTKYPTAWTKVTILEDYGIQAMSLVFTRKWHSRIQWQAQHCGNEAKQGQTEPRPGGTYGNSLGFSQPFFKEKCVLMVIDFPIFHDIDWFWSITGAGVPTMVSNWLWGFDKKTVRREGILTCLLYYVLFSVAHFFK